MLNTVFPQIYKYNIVNPFQFQLFNGKHHVYGAVIAFYLNNLKQNTQNKQIGNKVESGMRDSEVVKKTSKKNRWDKEENY